MAEGKRNPSFMLLCHDKHEIAKLECLVMHGLPRPWVRGEVQLRKDAEALVVPEEGSSFDRARHVALYSL